jgi:hypothetical protein
MKLVCLFIAAFICMLTLVPATAVEYGYYEYHASENLNDIDGTSNQSIWAVGDNGLIIHYDGAQWQEEERGTAENLVSIAAVDETHAYAVGEDVLLYYDAERWQRIDEISGGTKVESLPTGEAWVRGDYGMIHYFDGERWQLADLGDFNRWIQNFSVINSNDLWYLKVWYTSPGMLDWDLEAYHCYSGVGTRYWVYGFEDYYCWGSSCDVFALDNQHVWIWYSFDCEDDRNGLVFFGGGAWGRVSYEQFSDINGRLDGQIYATNSSGIYRIENNTQISLIESSIEEVTSIYVGSDGEYWATEGDSIRHYANWPNNKMPVGVKISGMFSEPGMATISACVQPAMGGGDVYILAKKDMTLSGPFYSILPGEKIVRGIQPYSRFRGILTSPIQRTIYTSYINESFITDYLLGIILIPAGEKIGLENALGYDLSRVKSSY